jgi:hypothetical protein
MGGSMRLIRFAAAACAVFFATPALAAFDVGDLICETTTTTGTGTVNLAGAVSNYVTFVSQIATGNTVPYHIRASDGKLETGVGTLTDGTPDTLTRVADWSTDGSGAELTLPAGTHTVCLGPISGSITNNPMTEDLDVAGFNFFDSTATFEISSDAITGLDGFVDNAAIGLGAGNYAAFTIGNTSDDEGGPFILTYADSNTAQDNDDVAGWTMYGNDDGGTPLAYAGFGAIATDTANTSEDGKFVWLIVTNGALATEMALDGTDLYPNADAGLSLGTAALGWQNLFLTASVEFGGGTSTTLTESSAGNLSVEGSVIEKAGTQMIYVPAAAMISRATSGADCSKTFDSGAADNTIRVCGFDTGTDEWAHFTISMPPRWNEGTITAQYVWTTGGASAPGETVSIDISCVAISDDDGLNNALGTPINVDDTMLSADLDLMTSAVSGAVTCAGTPAANDTVQFGVMRDVSDDNVAADMDLIGVRLFIVTDTANDG